MRIRNKKVTKNSVGQKTVTGRIVLTKDVKARNTSNDGKGPLDPRWRNPSFIVIAAGTEVDYIGFETMMAYYHKVRVYKNGIMFEKSIEDREHPCTR